MPRINIDAGTKRRIDEWAKRNNLAVEVAVSRLLDQGLSYPSSLASHVHSGAKSTLKDLGANSIRLPTVRAQLNRK